MAWKVALAIAGIGLMIILWRRNDVATFMQGLLQKFREAVPQTAEEVNKLIASHAALATENADLKAKLAVSDAKRVKAEADLAAYGDAIVVPKEEVDEWGNLVASVQNVGTAAAMPLMPKGSPGQP